MPRVHRSVDRLINRNSVAIETKAMTPLTLRALRTLYLRYVPSDSRHYNADDGARWWPAHEIGHLLTVPLENIGEPMFGIDIEGLNPETDIQLELKLIAYEGAAMSISHRLLVAAGHRELAKQEGKDTDDYTLGVTDTPRSRRRIQHILRDHRCLRIPRTVEGLENKLAAVVHAAKEFHARQV